LFGISCKRVVYTPQLFLASFGRGQGSGSNTPRLGPTRKRHVVANRRDQTCKRGFATGWAGRVARMREIRNKHNFGRVEPFGRPRRRWEDNIKMDIRDTFLMKGTGLIWLKMGSSGVIL